MGRRFWVSLSPFPLPGSLGSGQPVRLSQPGQPWQPVRVKPCGGPAPRLICGRCRCWRSHTGGGAGRVGAGADDSGAVPGGCWPCVCAVALAVVVTVAAVVLVLLLPSCWWPSPCAVVLAVCRGAGGRWVVVVLALCAVAALVALCAVLCAVVCVPVPLPWRRVVRVLGLSGSVSLRR